MIIGPLSQISPIWPAGQRLAVVVGDLDLHARHRLADAAGPLDLRRVEGDDRAGFGQAVAFEERHAEASRKASRSSRAAARRR